MAKIELVRKRDGRLVAFDETKITDAIYKAALAVGGEDRRPAEDLAGVVTLFLEKHYESRIPTIEDIQDMVEKALIETGHAKTAKAYILYRDKRARARESLQVRKRVITEGSSTDTSLLVEPVTRDELSEWSKSKIASALEVEADLDPSVAGKIAGTVEERVFASGMRRITTSLIRELVDNELFERGLDKQLARQSLLGMPKFDVQQLIMSKSKENSNISSNNPEAINLAIAETTLKQYALQEVFSDDVEDAHLNGKIHIHDLGYPTRVYCSSHSLEYIKKFGLKLNNLDTRSAPAKHARTLTGHLNTFLASMQAFYAGALGVGYINILYAPYVEHLSDDKMRQEAQHLIFSGSQNAFSRGGQTLFLDFNVHTGVPDYLRDIPAIGPGGKETGKSYGEYEEIAIRFSRAMLDVWRAGDSYGNVFAFPKCDLHVNDASFSDPHQLDLLRYACQIASENGTPYFVFDRDAVTLSACCRLRTKIEDFNMIKHLETMRFCGFQNVTINLPQCAYRAKGEIDAFFEEVNNMMELALKAHLQKRIFIKKLMSSPEMPLWQIGKKAMDGLAYVDLDKATYIIGLIGLNEAVERLTRRELHEGVEPLKLGLKIISYMHLKAKEFGKEHGLKISLEESPAESATRRLAKVDARSFPEAQQYLRGNKERDELYYTNSIHLRADAPVDLLQRIQIQSKFHPLIESGAIIHAFVGESRPHPDSILNLIEKTYRNTEAAQLTISPEFTVCKECNRSTRGLQQRCSHCDSANVYGITRIVGYFSRVDNWNKSKLGELADRRKGNYAVV